MTSELRNEAYDLLEEISQNLEIFTREKSIDLSFDFEGVNYQVTGKLYNHFDTVNTMCGIEDQLIDFTFKGTISGFSKADDECVMSETELNF